METISLWNAYQTGGDLLARDQLMLKHLRLVHHVARQVIRSSRVDAEFDDLVSAGTIGLMNAIDNFDTSRGLAFSTFAAPRIRGAILDDLRRRDHVPRSIRRKQRDISRAREALTTELRREPSDEEMADEMGIGVDKLWRWQRETEQASQMSIDQPMENDSGRSATAEEIIKGSGGEEIEEDINREQELQLLRDEILNLKEQERLVLSLYYFEELKLHEIASVLGVTESRISQIRSKAIQSLRGRLSHLMEGSGV
ncbi:MAG: FliA/WhiG family RNA polymerase sigma factor [Gemmatimonadota bacterium]|nr:FliA/WhiG family RNA polymerase sigma factor [Gemmatimonadota bacterium]MDH5758221.1 FliA/WhiG family RNA polymerase sigma factor [Gemmatimonadota bacterium]